MMRPFGEVDSVELGERVVVALFFENYLMLAHRRSHIGYDWAKNRRRP